MINTLLSACWLLKIKCVDLRQNYQQCLEQEVVIYNIYFILYGAYRKYKTVSLIKTNEMFLGRL